LKQLQSGTIRPAAETIAAINSLFDRGGGCFYGDGVVRMPGGKEKLVKDLKVGDQVMSENILGKSSVAMISHITCAKIDPETILVALKGGLLITANHPIEINQKWIHPCKLDTKVTQEPAYKFNVHYVYSIALSDSHSIGMFVDNIKVITLNHGICNDPVATHSYYGTNAVIRDIEFEDVGRGALTPCKWLVGDFGIKVEKA